MSQRNETITIAKAVAIMLMVTAHAGFYRQGQTIINMFHMPLFFFCSGYCFKEKYLSDARAFAFRRIKGIYWPFIKYELLFLALHNVFFHLDIYNGEYGFRGTTSVLYDWQAFARSAFNIIGRMRGSEQLLGGYWFLKSLFFASFLAYATTKACKNVLMGGVILLLISYLTSIAQIRIPFFNVGEREFMAASFFLAGQLCKTHKTANRLLAGCESWIAEIPVTALLFAITATASTLMPMEMLTLQPWGIFPYFFVALCGTTMVMRISHKVNHRLPQGRIRNLIIHIGDHTLEILTWHMLSFKIASLVIIWIESRPMAQLACFPVIPEDMADYNYFTPWWPLYLLAGIAIPLITTKSKTQP